MTFVLLISRAWYIIPDNFIAGNTRNNYSQLNCISTRKFALDTKVLQPPTQKNTRKKYLFLLHFCLDAVFPHIFKNSGDYWKNRIQKEDFNFDKPLMRTANSINYWRVSVCAESPKTPQNSRVLDSIVGIFYHNINVIVLVDATLAFVAERRNKNWWNMMLIVESSSASTYLGYETCCPMPYIIRFDLDAWLWAQLTFQSLYQNKL